MALQEAGQATIAYFYFDFTKPHKRDIQGALASLLTQLSAYSDSYCDIILSHIPQAFIYGVNLLPSTETMITCLKDMLALPVQSPVYIILDALDECPHHPDLMWSRGELLHFLKGLVDLQLPNLHICVTSRPEIDIRTALEPLASYSISIHDQNGHKKDLENYIRSYIYSGSDTFMTRWRKLRKEDKEWVIETLSERADGM